MAKLETPFALNWQVTLRIMDAKLAPRIRNLLRESAAAKNLKVREQEIRFSLEQSAEHKDRWRQYQQAIAQLTAAGYGDTKVLQCNKEAKSLYNIKTYEALGHWTATGWIWDAAACGR